MDKIPKQDEKISVALKKSTIKILDDIARIKVNDAIKNGSFDVINLIRSKRGRGVSYDTEINFLARAYLEVLSEIHASSKVAENNPELKKLIVRLSEINSFFNNNTGDEEEL